VKDALLETSKADRVAPSSHREPEYGKAADYAETAGVLVAPGDVVASAGRNHGHFVARSQTLRDQPSMEFGAAGDLRTVALDDDGQLHELP